MKRRDLPGVILVDLSRRTELAPAVERFLHSCCRLVPEDAVPARSWRDGVSAAIVCASTTDTAGERRIVRKVSELRGLPVLLVTEGADSGVISRLLSSGVSDFVESPAVEADIVPRMRRLLCSLPENDAPVECPATDPALSGLIGVSKEFHKVIDDLRFAASCDSTIFLRGETGTGKGVCARAIHDLSGRRGEPFVPVNCGAIPAALVENELFGHASEAFTGAASQRVGLVQAAERGTLFLDEVDSLTPSVQIKLLSLLEERQYRPLGSARTVKAGIRFIAATNADPLEAVRTGGLRSDFYYRLNAFTVDIPPLRRRVEDILPLARHFLRETAGELGRPLPALSPGAAATLLGYRWPGNVRELKHAMERATVLTDNRLVVTAREVGPRHTATELEASFTEFVAACRRDYLQRLLSLNRGNVTRSAAAAGMGRRTLQRLLESHGLDAAKYRDGRGRSRKRS